MLERENIDVKNVKIYNLNACSKVYLIFSYCYFLLHDIVVKWDCCNIPENRKIVFSIHEYIFHANRTHIIMRFIRQVGVVCLPCKSQIQIDIVCNRILKIFISLFSTSFKLYSHFHIHRIVFNDLRLHTYTES